MSRSGGRLTVFAVLVASLIAVLLGRTIQLQASEGDSYRAAAAGNSVRTIVEPAPRGVIVDQAGRPLAADRQLLQVVVDRTVLYALPDDGQDVLRRVAAVLGTTFEDLDDRLTPCGSEQAVSGRCWDGSSVDAIVVSGDLPMGRALPVIERPDEFPGVDVRSVTVRSYPGTQRERAAQVIGHLGEVNGDELESSGGALAPGDLVGRGGLEERYDEQLRGTDGQRTVVIDNAGRATTTISETAPVPGSTLVTSLDAKLQAVVEQQLAAAVDRARAAGFPGDSGSAVVLDVTDGRVLAMASYPDYNPSIWDGGISETDYRTLLDSQALLLAPVQGAYAPGSTFKPFTVAAMAEEGFDLDGSYKCPGTYAAGGRTFTNLESEAYGTISLRRAIEVSCNTVFYAAANRIWQSEGAVGSLDPVAASASDFGLGALTGIDLPGEVAGTLASPKATRQLWLDNQQKWCAAAAQGYPELRTTDPERADEYTALDKENCEAAGAWRQGDAMNAAIGQGLTAITPLQLAVAYAAIANGGTVYQPQVGKALVAPDGTATTIDPVARSVSAGPQALAFLRGAMQGVTAQGTASGAFAGFPLDQVPIAGKTGSAQVPGGKVATSWFASFAPADSPRYAVVLMVTQGGTGAGTSAPSVRAIYEALFGISGSAVDPARSVLAGGRPAADLPAGVSP